MVQHLTLPAQPQRHLHPRPPQRFLGEPPLTHSTSLRTLVIVPTYNEVDNVRPLIAGIIAHAPEVDVLFVDDNSQDGTRQEIASLIAERPGRVSMLSRAGKLGLGTAYVAGFHWGLERDYQALVEMDADLSHRAEDLAKILAALEHSPVVIGSRYITGGGTQNWSLLRRVISQGGSFYARCILGLKARDLTGGFNAWRSEVLRAIDPTQVRSEGYTFQVELKFRAHLAGFALREWPILFVERRAGQSKMSGGIVFEAIYRIWLLALQRPQILRDTAKRRGLSERS